MQLSQHAQIRKGIPFIFSAAAEQLIAHHAKVGGLPVQSRQPVTDDFHRAGPCTLGVIPLIGGQVGQVFQQKRPWFLQSQSCQVQRAFQGMEAFSRPHGAVPFHPAAAFLVPHLHGGQIVPRSRAGAPQAFGVVAFAAARAA